MPPMSDQVVLHMDNSRAIRHAVFRTGLNSYTQVKIGIGGLHLSRFKQTQGFFGSYVGD